MNSHLRYQHRHCRWPPQDVASRDVGEMISIVMALAAAVGTPPTVVATSLPVLRFEALSQPLADDPSVAPDKLGFARDRYQR